MKLRDVSIKWKILFTGIASLLLIAVILASERVNDIRTGANEAILSKSKAVALMAEAARDEMARKLRSGVMVPFDQLDKDKLISAVPIVTAMRIANENAKAAGYVFRAPKVSPRNPNNEPTDLELAVLRELDANNLPEKVVVDKDAIRYFRPIRLTAECLYCHGDPKGSTDPMGGIKEGWKEGEMHGAFEIIGSLKEANAAVASAKVNVILWTLLLIAAASGGMWLILMTSVVKPLRTCGDMVQAVAGGDMTCELSFHSNDELGVIGQQLNLMAEKLRTFFKDVSGGVGTISSASKILLDVSQQMSQGAETTTEKASMVAAAAEEMNGNMRSVAAAAEQISTNMGIVAQSTEAMTATVQEIVSNTGSTRAATGEMVEQTRKASTHLDALNRSAQEIGKIIEFITNISDQTNLLALNATIEAARAGDAGKGFAVVANEIKGLSMQTTNAAEEIKREITEIRRATGEAVREIGQVLKTVDGIDEMVRSVAAATEEQSGATRDIAGNISESSTALQEVTENVAQASTVSGDVAKDMAEVHGAARNIAAASGQVSAYSRELADLSTKLAGFIGQFKVGEARFDIGAVKTAHLMWSARLENMMKGGATLRAVDAGSHTNCEFGKWYYGSSTADIRSFPQYAEVGERHKEVHRLAKEVVVAFESGRKKEAEALLKEFDKAREVFVDVLDRLYRL